MATIIQDFTLISLTSISMSHLVWLSLTLEFSWPIYSIYAIRLARHLYKSWKNILLWYLFTLSTYWAIRLLSSFVKLLALSLVLVRVLARWQGFDTNKPLVIAKVLSKWLESWQIMRENPTWSMYMSGMVLEQLKAQQRII